MVLLVVRYGNDSRTNASMSKPFAKKFYSSKAWQDCRNEYARRKHYLCENCLRRGIYRPGVIVHHLIELDPVNINNPEIALSFNNLELLCRDCHAEVHEQVGGPWAKVNAKKKQEREAKNRYKIGPNGVVSAK